MTAPRRVHVEDLLGRRVIGVDGGVIGRLQEIRAERRDDVHEVVEYLLGPAAWLERMAMTRRLFGRRLHLLIARWDQIDISDPAKPRLTCPAGELKRERPRAERR